MDHIETKILNSYTIQEAAQNMVFAARLPPSIPLLISTYGSLHLAVNTRGWTYTSKISAMLGTQQNAAP